MLDADTKLLTAGRPFGAWEEERRNERRHYSIQPLSGWQKQKRNSECVNNTLGLHLGCFFFPLDFLLTLLWPKGIQSCFLNTVLKNKTLFFLQTVFGSYNRKKMHSYFCDLKIHEGETGWERVNWEEVLWKCAQHSTDSVNLPGTRQHSALLLKLCDRHISCSFHFQDRRAQSVGCCIKNSKWTNLLLNKAWTIFQDVRLKMLLGQDM